MHFPPGQLDRAYRFEVSVVLLPQPLPEGALGVGSPYELVLAGADAGAGRVYASSLQWTFTYTETELQAAGISKQRFDALAIYHQDRGRSGWTPVRGSRSITGNGRTSVWASFACGVGCKVRVGLPPLRETAQAAMLEASDLAIAPGATTSISCTPYDQSGGDLTYLWDADRGIISGAGDRVTWTAPGQPGPATVTCEISDSIGPLGTASIALVATHPEPPLDPIQRGACCICFDDGNVGDWAEAFSYMYGRYGMRATCFLQTNRLATRFASTSEQYKAMLAAGWEVGNHTVTGQSFSSEGLTTSYIVNELVLPAQDHIQEALALAEPPKVFAAPMGHWGVTVAEETERAEAMLAIFPTIRGTNSTFYRFPPQNLTTNHSLLGATTRWLDAYSVESATPLTITLAKHLVSLAAENNGLAVIHMHNVTDNLLAWDIRREDLRELIDHVAATGVRTLTLSELYGVEWLTDAPIVADGSFTRTATLWREVGARWPTEGQADWADFYYPYRPSVLEPGVVEIDPDEGHAAPGSVRIAAASAEPRFLAQRLTLQPNTTYTASAWVKTEGLEGAGAVLFNVGAGDQRLEAPAAIDGVWLNGTNDWTRIAGTFRSGPVGAPRDTCELWLLVEGTRGVAWFDDIEVVPAAS